MARLLSVNVGLPREVRWNGRTVRTAICYPEPLERPTAGNVLVCCSHFAGGIVPGDGVFTTWSYRAGAGRAEAFLLNPQPIAAQTAYEWGVVAEVVANGKALTRAEELAELYLKAPEVTRRNTRVHFIRPLKERIVREVGLDCLSKGRPPPIS